MTISTDPDDLKKLKALAERNIANGDWGDEVTFSGETVPITPDERATKGFVSQTLAKIRGRRLPKK